jgi:VCBS repeat protein
MRSRRGYRISLPIAVLAMLSGCWHHQAKQNSAPRISDVVITPAHPRTADDLVVSATAQDADDDALTLTYAWKRNGTLIAGVNGLAFPASQTRRGDVIVATVSASDGIHTTSAEATVTIEDTPPVLSVPSPPTEVTYGDRLTFQVTAADPDGDVTWPLIVSLGPAGFAVSDTGAVTWHAVAPMFEPSMDIHWAISLRDHPESTVSGTLRLQDPGRRLPLARSTLFIPEMREQLAVADLDADGIDDVLLADYSRMGVLSNRGSDYVQTWVYPYLLSGPRSNGITAIAAADVSGDANEEIFVAANGVLHQLRGTDRREALALGAGTLSNCYELRVADLDGDGEAELICLATDWDFHQTTGSTGIAVYRASDLSLEWQVADAGDAFAIGNVDADAALEIVTASGKVYDGATHQLEWEYPAGFGAPIDSGDLDGDGIEEIIAVRPAIPPVDVDVYNAVQRAQLATLVYSELATFGVGALRVADTDGDAVPEVIVGGAHGAYVTGYHYDPATQTFSAVAHSGAGGGGSISTLQVGNTDADPTPEILWGSGQRDYGGAFGIGEWRLPADSISSGGGMLARIAPDSERILFTSSAFALAALDAQSGAVSFPPIHPPAPRLEPARIDIADYNGDGIDEAFISWTGEDPFVPLFATHDLTSDTIEWTSAPGFARAAAITHADFNGDGLPDPAVLSVDGRITVFDVLHWQVLWQSTPLAGNAIALAVADLDHDGQPELIALTSGYLYVYGRADSSSPFTERRAVANAFDVSSLVVADADGDGEYELFVANDLRSSPPRSQVRVYDRNLQPLRTFDLDFAVSDLLLEPGSDPRKNLLSAGEGFIRALDAVSGAEIWRSPAGVAGPLHALDVNHDGAYELVFAGYDRIAVTQ